LRPKNKITHENRSNYRPCTRGSHAAGSKHKRFSYYRRCGSDGCPFSNGHSSLTYVFIYSHPKDERKRGEDGLQYVNGLYTAVGTSEIKENFLLLNATAAYRATDNLSVWVKGENLLAQKYEINLGYPMPRATFMAGINVNL